MNLCLNPGGVGCSDAASQGNERAPISRSSRHEPGQKRGISPALIAPIQSSSNVRSKLKPINLLRSGRPLQSTQALPNKKFCFRLRAPFNPSLFLSPIES
jgi:hypothetical protein